MTTDESVRLSRIRALCASGDAKLIRKRHLLSLADVASTIGVDQSTVWRWEEGVRKQPRGAAALRYEALLATLERAGVAL